MAGTDSLADTIVARATGAGAAAVAIVRLSGPEARRIAGVVAPGAERGSHRLYPARVLDAGGAVIDRAMVVEMHGRRSYTGENVVELQLRGSAAVVQAAIDRCVGAGARLARAGEFTLRAFLNG